MGFQWFNMSIMWIFLLVMFIIMILFRLFFHNKWQNHFSRIYEENNCQQQSPLDIIQKRYAKGDITKDEYMDMKKEFE